MRNNNPPSRKLTLEDAIEIWKLRTSGMFQNRIAAIFDCNSGRVSEVLKGHKFPEAKALAFKE